MGCSKDGFVGVLLYFVESLILIFHVNRGEELGVYYTKKTPVYSVHFSRKNLLYALGNFVPSS